jgi:hypothetical protein
MNALFSPDSAADGQKSHGIPMHMYPMLDSNTLPVFLLHQSPKPLHGKCQALNLSIKLVHLIISFVPIQENV